MDRLSRNSDLTPHASRLKSVDSPRESLRPSASQFSLTSEANDDRQQLILVSQTLHQVEAQRNAIVEDRASLEEELQELREQLRVQREDGARELADKMEAASLDFRANSEDAHRQRLDLEKQCAELEKELQVTRENNRGDVKLLQDTVHHLETLNAQLLRDKEGASGRYADVSERCAEAQYMRDALQTALDAKVSELNRELEARRARDRAAQEREEMQQHACIRWKNKYLELQSAVVGAVGGDTGCEDLSVSAIKGLLEERLAQSKAVRQSNSREEIALAQKASSEKTQKLRHELSEEKDRYEALSRNLTRLANRVSGGSSKSVTPNEAIRCIGQAWTETLSSGLRPKRNERCSHSTSPIAVPSVPPSVAGEQRQEAPSESTEKGADDASLTSVAIEAPQSTLVDDLHLNAVRLSGSGNAVSSLILPSAPVLNPKRESGTVTVPPIEMSPHATRLTTPSFELSPPARQLPAGTQSLDMSPASGQGPGRVPADPALLLRDSLGRSSTDGSLYWHCSQLDPRERYRADPSTARSSTTVSSVASSPIVRPTATVQPSQLLASPEGSAPSAKKAPSSADIPFASAENPVLSWNPPSVTSSQRASVPTLRLTSQMRTSGAGPTDPTPHAGTRHSGPQRFVPPRAQKSQSGDPFRKARSSGAHSAEWDTTDDAERQRAEDDGKSLALQAKAMIPELTKPVGAPLSPILEELENLSPTRVVPVSGEAHSPVPVWH